MIVQILTDKNSWKRRYYPSLEKVIYERFGYFPRLCVKANQIKEGDYLFLLGVTELLSQETLKLNRHNLVIHESKLPKGRGWSPLAWQILEGKNTIPITMFEASAKLDEGLIYQEDEVILEGHELRQEIERKVFFVINNMILEELQYRFADRLPGDKQKGLSTYYPRRTPESCEININKTLKEQFNLLRIADNEKFPISFRYKGYKYILKVRKE